MLKVADARPGPGPSRCRGSIGQAGARGKRARLGRVPGLAWEGPAADIRAWKVGGGRYPRQPGQIRKEAAVTSSVSGRSPAFHPGSPASSQLLDFRMAEVTLEFIAHPLDRHDGFGRRVDVPRAEVGDRAPVLGT